MVTYQQAESKDRKKLRRLQVEAQRPAPPPLPIGPGLPEPSFTSQLGAGLGGADTRTRLPPFIGTPRIPAAPPETQQLPEQALPDRRVELAKRLGYGEAGFALGLPPTLGIQPESEFAKGGALPAGEALKRVSQAPLQFAGETQELAAAEAVALWKLYQGKVPPSQIGRTRENLEKYRKLPLAARLPIEIAIAAPVPATLPEQAVGRLAGQVAGAGLRVGTRGTASVGRPVLRVTSEKARAAVAAAQRHLAEVGPPRVRAMGTEAPDITKGAIVEFSTRGVPAKARVVSVRADGLLVVDAGEFQMAGHKRILKRRDEVRLLSPAPPAVVPKTVSVNGVLFHRMADGKTYTAKRGGERLTYQELQEKGPIESVEFTSARVRARGAGEAGAEAPEFITAAERGEVIDLRRLRDSKSWLSMGGTSQTASRSAVKSYARHVDTENNRFRGITPEGLVRLNALEQKLAASTAIVDAEREAREAIARSITGIAAGERPPVARPPAGEAIPQIEAPAPKVAPQAPGPMAKEPWEMTLLEWERAREAIRPDISGAGPRVTRALVARRGEELDRLTMGVGFPDRMVTHRDIVEFALTEGKPVPLKVLAQYPDLARQAVVPEAPPAPKVESPAAMEAATPLPVVPRPVELPPEAPPTVAQAAPPPAEGPPSVTVPPAEPPPPTAPPPTAGALPTPPAASGRRFVGGRPSLLTLRDEVVTSDNPVVRLIVGRTGVNPSILATSDVGKSLVALSRAEVADDELLKTALGAALDRHATPLVGTMSRALPIDEQGFYGKTGKLWQDVFSRPDDYDVLPAGRAYIDDFHAVIDELEEMRVVAGLEPRPKRSAEGWLYTPRQTKTVRGIELRRPSSPKLQRHYEEATEGWAKGVRYDTDPRATLELHGRVALREIREAELSTALEPLSIAPSELIPQGLRNAMEAARAERLAAINERRALTVSRAQERVVGVPEARKRRAELATARADSDARLAAARSKYYQVKNQYTRAMDAAKKKEFAPGTLFGNTQPDEIPIAMWRNRFYPRADADALKKGMERAGIKGFWPRALQTTGDTIRFLASVGDWAAPFVQGLLSIARYPVRWAKASAMHFYAWLNPTVLARDMDRHLKTYQEMASYGIPVGDPEFFRVLEPGLGPSPGKLLEKLPQGAKARVALQTVGKQTAGRFQAAYNTFHGVMRRLIWEAERDNPKWQGKLPELAAYIRNMTGGLDSRALGVGPLQRGGESMWLAFSPRLLRSTTALMTDAFRLNTTRGRASFRALGGLITAGVGLYVLAGIALGKKREEIETGLNPLSGKRFLSHQINGDWIGIGGQVRSLTQAMIQVISAPLPGGEPAASLRSTNLEENPILRLYSRRGAPALGIVGAAAEAATGGQVDVLPFERIDSLPDLAKHLGTSALPFAVQGRMEGQDAITSFVGLTGLRTSAETFGEMRQRLGAEVVEDLIAQKPELATLRDVPYKQLPTGVARTIQETPEVEELREKMVEPPRDLRGRALVTERMRIWNEAKVQLEKPVGDALRARRPLSGIREDIQTLKDRRFAISKVLFDNPEFKAGLTPRDAHIWDVVAEMYWAADAPVDVETGRPDFDGRDRVRAVALQKAKRLGVPDAYILGTGAGTYRGIRFKDPQVRLVVERYERDVEALRPYWEIDKTMIPRLAPANQVLWRQYLDATPERQKGLRPRVAGLIQMRNTLRENMRMQDRHIDDLLVKWYGYTAKHPPMKPLRNPAVRPLQPAGAR